MEVEEAKAEEEKIEKLDKRGKWNVEVVVVEYKERGREGGEKEMEGRKAKRRKEVRFW